ncbi:hypothetical protein A176_004245 [Myxococcus hansupus]|uniref:Uncharacterized protein n=1 Tax=Pseudomyxococcus hansupus TaxID=1297742 RepID=A0A0H4X0D1_9BACT|nr:hypothetical protein A176_004245 [Myxococcus hansupus]
MGGALRSGVRRGCDFHGGGDSVRRGDNASARASVSHVARSTSSDVRCERRCLIGGQTTRARCSRRHSPPSTR